MGMARERGAGFEGRGWLTGGGRKFQGQRRHEGPWLMG